MTYPPAGNPDPYGQQQPDPYGQQPQQPQPDPYNPYAAPGSPAAPQQYGQQPQPYSAQPYAQQPYAQPSAPTNTMAILSLVFAFVFAPLAIVFGHMAKKQIKQTGEGGDGLATAGMVIGYIFTGLGVLLCCVYGIIFVVALNSTGSTY
ncbi:MAG: DUF4190 domain-containing protein [Hamadaea sp.]|uniref:DUF4190 domain-containing protein n=1 Tax=Hamadaea sp. TaxID=2024425 RepID=UPI0017F9B503|nr:DUF4190 domain-containing protein [Hamadaea sp.]NUR71256.1 DUF4190 domain-containing protein [Hamadaea sp.]NUT23140.1 DUF4190 domain-containing protein [Hamadaea sp.]